MSRTHDREFSDVIYKRLTCLEEAGGSIDRRLAAYPEHGAELRPLLEVAAALCRWPTPKQRQAAIAAGKRLQPTEKADV